VLISNYFEIISRFGYQILESMRHNKLILARKLKGITQSEISSKIAMEQTTYSRKERGKSPISDDEWNRISKALDLPINEIKDNSEITFNNDINEKMISIPLSVFNILIKYNIALENEILNLKLIIENKSKANIK
jgi:transcriptional regulator with XRE-family HTH domain